MIDRLLDFVDSTVGIGIAIFLVICMVIGGIIGLIRWNVLVTCDHWEDSLDRPTRLDTWGEGCLVTLDDGTELPVHQYLVVNDGER